jgi:hypothetical protein
MRPPPSRSRTIPTFALLAIAAAASAPACGLAPSLDVSGSGGSGVGGFAGGVGGFGGDVSVETGEPAVPKAFDYASLCGEGACEPGQLATCGASGDGRGGGGGAAQGGAGGAGPQGAGGGGDPDTEQGCQLVSDGGLATPTCGPVGPGGSEAACQSNADCADGLGCVALDSGAEPNAVGLCRPYCCGELEACPSGTFCAPQALLADTTSLVPVCRPVEPCALLAEGGCASGTACTVVRADGTTSCAPTGTGGLCDPCPCAEGFVCSLGTNECQQLCRTDLQTECPGGAICQGGGALPDGVGVCVGSDTACGMP